MARTRLERLRRHRVLIEVAVAEGLSLEDARELLIERRRWATERARESVRDVPRSMPAAQVEDEPREPRYWWERM